MDSVDRALSGLAVGRAVVEDVVVESVDRAVVEGGGFFSSPLILLKVNTDTRHRLDYFYVSGS